MFINRCFKVGQLIKALPIILCLFSPTVTAEDISLNKGYKTLEEAKASLENSLHFMEFMLGEKSILDGLKSVDPKASAGPRYESSPVLASDAAQTMALFQELINSIEPRVYQRIAPPKSSINLAFLSSEEKGTFDDSLSLTKAIINEIKYENGEVKTVSISAHESSDLAAIFAMDGPSVISSIKGTATFEFPKQYRTVVLSDAKNIADIDGHQVLFKRLSDNSIRLEYSSTIDDRIVASNGWTQDNKAIRRQSYSKSDVFDKAEIGILKSMLLVAKKTIKRIEQEEFKNVEELNKYLAKNTPVFKRSEKNKPRTKAQILAYYGEVSEVHLTVSSVDKSTVNLAVQATSFNVEDNTTGYYSALDDDTSLEGLIDAAGHWLIKPTFSSLSHYEGNFFVNFDDDQYYFLDKEKSSLIAIAYEPLSELFDGLWKVESSDRYQGVFNIRDQKVIIPVKYDYLTVKDGFIVAESTSADRESTQRNLFNQNGKILLSG